VIAPSSSTYVAAQLAVQVTRTISAVTPVYKPVLEYLKAAYESLASQELPAGWTWQWVVQEDGQTGDVAAMLPDDPRISSGAVRRSGESVTRTMCLSRAKGELIKVLDADDILTPGTLAREIAVLSANQHVGWTTCRVLDLLPDGSTQGFEFDPAEGLITRGAVLEHWRAHDYRAPVHPATLCMRRDLVFALGGWMALPGSGDTALLMAANAASDGYFIGTPGLLYRKWPGQLTSQPAHNDPAERKARMNIIDHRATELRRLWDSRGS
jgi:glycosyltransferase involved in cell wall biosynthesis